MKHRTRRAAGHPIAPPSGIVAVSRLNLYDKIGPGPHACHWCGTQINWGRGLSTGIIVADHLNHDATDDSPDNLVPSCNSCNAGRAQGAAYNKNRILPGELYVIAASGRRSRAKVRECETCGSSFVAKVSEINSGKGRFCSRSCARRTPRNR